MLPGTPNRHPNRRQMLFSLTSVLMTVCHFFATALVCKRLDVALQLSPSDERCLKKLATKSVSSRILNVIISYLCCICYFAVLAPTAWGSSVYRWLSKSTSFGAQQSCLLGKLERCPELTHDVPSVEETQEFILAERRARNDDLFG